MGLIKAATLLQYINLYRVLYIGGRYGGGKTALAFRLAYDLITRGDYRYLISNVKSVWNDKVTDIQLRSDTYVDAIVILDEGGIFLETGKDVKKYLAYLRKMNIALIIPSVQEIPRSIRRLSVQRLMTFNVYGVPLWLYRFKLDVGDVKEKDWFVWWRPSEIFGIYDTLGTPSDDAGFNEYLTGVTREVQRKTGYTEEAREAITGVGTAYTARGFDADQESPSGSAESLLEEIRGVSIALEEAQDEISGAVSVLGRGKRTRRKG